MGHSSMMSGMEPAFILWTLFMSLLIISNEGFSNDSSKKLSPNSWKIRHQSQVVRDQSPITFNQSSRFSGLYTGPYFDPERNPGNVTAEMGKTAVLPCKVKQLGQRMVSWIRMRDMHILSVATTTFISDDRFFVIRDENEPDKWDIHIKYVHPRDAGLYQCQISTKPKTSNLVRLSVIETKVYIVGNSDVHANAGSNVVFTCRIEGAVQKPAYIFWYHDSSRLMSDSPNVNMTSRVREIEGSEEHRSNTKSYEATLELKDLSFEQNGNFSCRPSNAKSASVRLHVIDGEIRAAMSEGTSCSSSIQTFNNIGLLLIFWNHHLR